MSGTAYTSQKIAQGKREFDNYSYQNFYQDIVQF
jgi:hypothetical protein